MIQLKDKPEKGPSLPYSIGKDKGKCKLEVATSRVKAAYDKGNLKVYSYQQKLWGDEAIKKVLKEEVQKNRCCYCEKDITDEGELEHWRPREGFQQARGKSIEKPGYYWLAYEWSNWFYSCTTCNKRKRNLFPLKDESKRCKSHRSKLSCSGESPLLIHPSEENPKDFLEYIGYEIVAKGNDKDRGNAQIDVMELSRKGLFDKRVGHRAVSKGLEDLLVIQPDNLIAKQLYNQSLEEAAQPGKVFSYMVRCNLDRWKKL